MKQNLIIPELKQDIELRLDRVRSLMERDGISALLVASNANIFYLTGRFFRGYIYLSSEGLPYFFVIRPSVFEDCDNVIAVRKPEQIDEVLESKGVVVPGNVALELDSLSWAETTRLRKALKQDLTAMPADCTGLLREARMVKTQLEIKLMRADGARQAGVYRRIAHLYKPGMTDIELQVEIERALRLEGSLGYARTAGRLMEINMGSVISGDNADSPGPYEFAMGGAGVNPALPVGADGKTMAQGTSVMIDMNGCFNGYQTDMTRVWRIGKLPEPAMKAHACSLKILHTLEKVAVPGCEVCRLYEIAEEIAQKDGLSHYFMGHAQKAGFIGHGVGIELNEQPAITSRNRTVLQENMTLALEPKFVIPGVGAVGAENTYRVTSEGLENLTPLNEEIEELS